MPLCFRLADGVNHRFVVELRYLQGELYWDRCGSVARTLAMHEGWSPRGIDTNGCHIVHDDDNVVFSFGPSSLSMAQTQDRDVSTLWEPGNLGATSETFASEVIKAFQLDAFSRIGFRQWILFETDSPEEASETIGDMSMFSPAKSLSSLGALSKSTHSVEIARETNSVRLTASPFEQPVVIPPSVLSKAKSVPHYKFKEQRKALVEKYKAKKAIESYPRTGVLIDMDAYIEDPPDTVKIRPFVLGAHEDFKTILKAVLSKDE